MEKLELVRKEIEKIHSDVSAANPGGLADLLDDIEMDPFLVKTKKESANSLTLPLSFFVEKQNYDTLGEKIHCIHLLAYLLSSQAIACKFLWGRLPVARSPGLSFFYFSAFLLKEVR